MKIGIFGCGYVGKALAMHFKEAGNRAFVTTRNPDRIPELEAVSDGVFLLEQETDYLNFLNDLDVLIISVAPNGGSDYRSTYLEAPKRLINLFANAPSLKQVIYTSSTSVYGEHAGGFVNESTDCKPLNDNGLILQEAENQLLSAATDRLQVCIFRLGEIYGQGRLIEERLKNSCGKIFPGDGSQYTNLIHVDDIVRACNLAIEKHLGGIYNLCNDFRVSRKELYDALCQQFNLPSIQWSKELTGPHGGNKRVSNQKLKNLGFTFSQFAPYNPL